MIIEIHRGHIRLELDGKTVTIAGEAYLPGFGSPDFVVYRTSIQHWDPPHDQAEIDEQTRTRILEELASNLADKGMSFEIE